MLCHLVVNEAVFNGKTLCNNFINPKEYNFHFPNFQSVAEWFEQEPYRMFVCCQTCLQVLGPSFNYAINETFINKLYLPEYIKTQRKMVLKRVIANS